MRTLAWVGLVVLSSSLQAASAATLARLNLAAEGSTDPPGDRLDLLVYFAPGEKSLTLEVRGFARWNGEQKVAPMKSRTASSRGADGELLIVKKVPAPAGASAAEVSVVIPYADIDAPRGKHQYGYEVTGRHEMAVDFVQATSLIPLEITDKSRQHMQPVAEPPKYVPDSEPRIATVVKDGKVGTAEVEIETLRLAPETKDFGEFVKVSVPGEFNHPQPRKASAPPPDSVRAAVPLEGKPWGTLAQYVPQKHRTIFYATNRDVVNSSAKTIERFGSEAGPVTYGECVINIPIEQHIGGKLDTPSWWESADPQKHFLVEFLEPLKQVDFRRELGDDDVLLFVHGYNTSFEFSVLRTGQLMHDLKFPGRAVAFSWPSAGSLSGYFHDESQVEPSAKALVEVFKTLQAKKADGKGTRKVHAIVHSMGNRIFLTAVREFELQQGKEKTQKMFGQVALAAPDVAASLFGALIPSVVRQSDHVTLYYCQSDRALKASRAMHQDMPVGLGPCFAEGVDTINAEAVNTEVLGHGYYASTHELLTDLRLLVSNHLAPDKRLPPLKEKTLVLGFPHWTFLPVQSAP